MIDTVLKVFLLEDRQMDAELTKRALLKFAPNSVVTVANSEKEFLQRIHWGEYDIVLADYHLPGYNGLEALLYVREHFPHIPFVFVTGQLDNEEKAAAAVLSGANGYVLKENLKQLGEAVSSALDRASANRQKAEELAARRQERSLMLQKALYLVRNADDFTEKGEVEAALQKVLEIG